MYDLGDYQCKVDKGKFTTVTKFWKADVLSTNPLLEQLFSHFAPMKGFYSECQLFKIHYAG